MPVNETPPHEPQHYVVVALYSICSQPQYEKRLVLWVRSVYISNKTSTYTPEYPLNLYYGTQEVRSLPARSSSTTCEFC